MKKLLTIFIAVLMAISVFAFSACGGDSAEGTIDGKYSKVSTEAEFGELMEKVETAKLVKKKAKTAGGTFKAEEEIKIKIGKKSATLSGSSVLDVILDLTTSEREEIISGLSAESSLTFKTDKGFAEQLYNVLASFEDEGYDLSYEEFIKEDAQGNLIFTALDKANIESSGKMYIKDSALYVDGKVTGIPSSIKDLADGGMGESDILDDLEKGVKYKFDEDNSDLRSLFRAAKDVQKTLVNFEMPDDVSEQLTFDEVNKYLVMVDAELSADNTDSGLKIKLATTDTTKDKVAALLVPELKKSIKDFSKIVKDFTISKMDVEVYVSLASNGVINAVAANFDIEISATVNGTSVSIALESKADMSFEEPEIEYPSFKNYDEFGE